MLTLTCYRLFWRRPTSRGDYFVYIAEVCCVFELLEAPASSQLNSISQCCHLVNDSEAWWFVCHIRVNVKWFWIPVASRIWISTKVYSSAYFQNLLGPTHLLAHCMLSCPFLAAAEAGRRMIPTAAKCWRQAPPLPVWHLTRISSVGFMKMFLSDAVVKVARKLKVRLGGMFGCVFVCLSATWLQWWRRPTSRLLLQVSRWQTFWWRNCRTCLVSTSVAKVHHLYFYHTLLC